MSFKHGVGAYTRWFEPRAGNIELGLGERVGYTIVEAVGDQLYGIT